MVEKTVFSTFLFVFCEIKAILLTFQYGTFVICEGFLWMVLSAVVKILFLQNYVDLLAQIMVVELIFLTTC